MASRLSFKELKARFGSAYPDEFYDRVETAQYEYREQIGEEVETFVEELGWSDALRYMFEQYRDGVQRIDAVKSGAPLYRGIDVDECRPESVDRDSLGTSWSDDFDHALAFGNCAIVGRFPERIDDLTLTMLTAEFDGEEEIRLVAGSKVSLEKLCEGSEESCEPFGEGTVGIA